MGIAGSSIGETRSDYERACADVDYLNLEACGTGEVLVLGDEPLRSAFVRQQDGTVIVARWWACESSERAEHALMNIPSSLPELEDPKEASFDGDPLIMFDSALVAAHANKLARIEVDAGTYKLTSEKYESPHSFDFLIHRLIRLS
jgi:hypothetical protein